MQNHRTLITIDRPRVVNTLIALTAGLFFLHGSGLFLRYGLGHPNAKGFVPMFNLDTEGNIPTFVSALIFVVASLLAYWITRNEECAGSKYAPQWRLMSMIFFFLAMDEASGIHELANRPLQNAFELNGGVFYNSWVLAGMTVVILLTALYFRFVVDLPARLRNELLLAAAFYLTGVLVFEVLGGNFASLHGRDNIAYELIATGEELFEITGLIILVNALFKYLQTHPSKIEIATTG